MSMPDPETLPETILVVDADILVRHVIADYLRTCGYTVQEAASGREVQIILEIEAERTDVVLADADAQGDVEGFALARWLRENYPHIDVILAGTPMMAAARATDLCEDGPAVHKPYQPQSIADRIKWLMAQRARRRT